MTKVAIDGTIFESQSYGGVSRIYHEILPRMCHLDESMRFFFLTAGKLQQTVPQHSRIQHHALRYWEMLLRPGRYFRRVKLNGRYRAQSAWLQENQIDIWHSTYYTLPIRWRGPVVITAYDLIYFHLPQMFEKRQGVWTRSHIQKAVLAADVIICISATTREDLKQAYDIDPAKFQVIPLGVGSKFRRIQTENPVESGERPFILYVGSRERYKNFSMLLHAYSRWTFRSEIDLLVVGSPWTRAEVKQLHDIVIAGNVRLETAVTDHKLSLLYNQAAAFIYPSLYEGFGLPLVEAMACGCPVVASSIPTSEEIAGDTAYYFEPDSVEDLLVALDKAVSEGRLASRVEKGLRLASNYSWETTARQTLEVYHALT